MIWLGIGLGALGCYGAKVAGLALPTRLLEDTRVRRVATLLPVALLAALAALQTFADGRHLAIDARAAGVAGAVIALRWRAPFLVVVVVAAGVTATVRALA